MLTNKRLPTLATTGLATAALKLSNSKRNAGRGSPKKRSKRHEFLTQLLGALARQLGALEGGVLVEMEEDVYAALLSAFQPEIIEKQDPHLLVESIVACLCDFAHFDSVCVNMVQFQQLIGITEESSSNRRVFARYQSRLQTHGIESLEDMLACDIGVIGELLSVHPRDTELSLLFEQIAGSL